METELALPSRNDVVGTIVRSSLSGNLGLFVGTGFSKAATDGGAPTFHELLSKLVKQLGLDSDINSEEQYRFKSYPQIATTLLEEYVDSSVSQDRANATECDCIYEESDATEAKVRATREFRTQIAHICNLIPDEDCRTALSDGIKKLRPSCVITTNYDLILEHLLNDATTVLPDQPLVPNAEHIPIYHLHCHRLDPSSIKITEEDYVGLLAPLDYQKMKLPLLLLESTTLMLGYKLGDINVRAAMEWSKSFMGSDRLRVSSEQGVVIQALYKPENPKDEPYRGVNGELV